MADYGTDYYQVHAQGIEEAMCSLGGACPQLLWNAQNYRCLPSGRQRGAGLTEGGFRLDADLTVTLLAKDFGAGPYPQAAEFLQYPADEQFQFRIDTVTWMPGRDVIRIKATAANKL
jgi:hypothetical protein